MPDPAAEKDPARKAAYERALGYMGLDGAIDQPLESIPVDKVRVTNVADVTGVMGVTLESIPVGKARCTPLL